MCTGAHAILALQADGRPAAGGAGSLSPKLPVCDAVMQEGGGTGIAVSPVSDRLFVCNWRNRGVFELDYATGAIINRVEAKVLQQPALIAINHSGVLYIGDHQTNSVHVFTSDGRYVTSFGGSRQVEPRPEYQFASIRGIACTRRSDHVVVADGGYLKLFDRNGLFVKYIGVNAASGQRTPAAATSVPVETAAASPAKRITAPAAPQTPTPRSATLPQPQPQAPLAAHVGATARPKRVSAAQRSSQSGAAAPQQQLLQGSRASSTSSANSAGTSCSSPATPKPIGLYGGLVIDANDYILATFSHRGRCTVHVHSPIDVPPRGSPQRPSGGGGVQQQQQQQQQPSTQTTGEREQSAVGAGESSGGELLYEIDSEADRLGARAGGLAALQLPPVSNAAVMPNTIVASLLYVLDMNSSCIKVYRYRSDSSGH